MKVKIPFGLLLITHSFAFLGNAQAQAPFVSDSLSVFWEQLDGPPGYVFKYGEGGGKIFAGTEGGLYYSADGGKNWKFNHRLGKHKLLNLWVKDSILFALAYRKVANLESSFELKPLECYGFRSTDHGETWEMVFDTDDWIGNHFSQDLKKTELFSTADSTLIMCISTTVYSRIWTSQNAGQSWYPSQYNHDEYIGLSSVDGITAGLWRGGSQNAWNGLVSTEDGFGGLQVISLSSLLPDVQEKTVRAAYQSGIFYLFLSDGTIYRTNNEGVTWGTDTLSVPGILREVIWTDGDFYFRTSSGIWKGAPSSLTKIYDGEGGSTSDALTFSKTQSGFWVNSNLLRTMHSTNVGEPWADFSKGLVARIINVSSICGKLVGRHTTENYYATPLSISNTEDGAWEQSNYGIQKVLGEANGYSYIYGPPFMRSKDCGVSWDTLTNLLVQAAPQGIVQSGERIFLWNNSGAPIFFSDNNGNSWAEIQLPYDYASCNSFLVSSDTIYFLDKDSNGLFRTFNLGQSWEEIVHSQNINQIFWTEKKQLVGLSENSSKGKLFLSTDHGVTFNQTFETTAAYPYMLNFYVPRIRFPLVLDGLILLQASNGVFISYNEGVSWTRLRNLPFFNFTFDDSQTSATVIGGYTEGARFFHVDDGYLYAATEAQGIWRTELAPIRDHALVAGNKYGFLKGQFFRDLDNTCDYNSSNGDIPLGHKPLTIQPGNITAVTDANGKYLVALPPGNYTVHSPAPNYHFVSCSTGQPSAVTPGNASVADMIYQPEPDILDLCILFTTPVRPRPGFWANYNVQVSNAGTAPVASAVLTIDFDAQWLEPVNITPFGQFAGHQAIINLPELAPGQVVILNLGFTVSTSTPLGTELSFVAQCPVSGDAYPANNRTVTTQTVTGSFDPNDKTAQPVQIQPPFQPRTFDYLIRFQNTGTDTAFTVVVTDTLDERFDLMSIRNVESSHDFEFRLLEGRVAKWIFRNILLPDSNTNEAASHGYLRFQIQTKTDALPGTEILNNADIFFDFNSPVRTNEAAISNPKWVVTNALTVELCEGSVWNGSVWDESTTLSDTTSDAWSDTILSTTITVHPTWTIKLDTTVAKGSLLFGVPILSDTLLAFHFETMDGCDSTMIWEVTSLTSEAHVPVKQGMTTALNPNPSAGIVWLKVGDINGSGKSWLRIRLRDTGNRLCKEWNRIEITGVEPLSLSLEGLPSGIYFIDIQSSDYIDTKMLVKI